MKAKEIAASFVKFVALFERYVQLLESTSQEHLGTQKTKAIKAPKIKQGARNGWSKDEDEILLRLRADKVSYKQITKVLAKSGYKRSAMACQSRAMQIKQTKQ